MFSGCNGAVAVAVVVESSLDGRRRGRRGGRSTRCVMRSDFSAKPSLLPAQPQGYKYVIQREPAGIRLEISYYPPAFVAFRARLGLMDLVCETLRA